MLLPIVLFMSANYSYDPWTIGFLTLATVTFIETIKDKHKLTSQDIFIIIISLLCVATAKAAYLGLVFFFAIVNKNEFTNKKLYYIYIICVLC